MLWKNLSSKIQKLWKLINLSKKILLINHIRMDPDAYWSLMWLYSILKKLWKEVKAINDDKTPNDFEFLWWQNTIQIKLNITDYNPDLIIALDAGSPEQLWDSYKNNKDFIDKKNFVVIDHHITNNWYWNLNIINKKSSSTCEIIYEITKELNLKDLIDKEIATFLITGIITDTNIYYNLNTSAKTLQIASELTKMWANSRLPIFHFYRKKEFNKTKLWGEILKKIKKTDNWKIVWVIIKDTDFKKTKTWIKDISGLINEFLTNIEWSDVCFILYSIDNKRIKVSFRSNYINVWNICSLFWWWWHKLAAGFISEDKIENIEKKILKILKDKIN